MPGSFRATYDHASEQRLAALPSTAPLLTDADLAPLPPLLQAYLRRVGAVGKPRVKGFRARFHGRFRQGVAGRWMSFRSEQHNFLEPSARLFFMRASSFGLPAEAYHSFVDSEARFRVRLLWLLDVVDGRGPEMNQGETVTIFNDLCVLAPAMLVDAPVTWLTEDTRTIRGSFTRGDQTVSARLTFDDHGDLTDFVSEDRFYSVDGKAFRKLPWSTPVRGYRDFDGMRLPARGDATWKLPEGDFVYGEFNLDEVTYFPGRASIK